MQPPPGKEVPGLQELRTSLPLTVASILPSPGFCHISVLPTYYIVYNYNPSPDFVNKVLLEGSALMYVLSVAAFSYISRAEHLSQRL